MSVTTLPAWLRVQLGVDATSGVDTIDWLVIPQQSLLETTKGAVYHDDRGDLERVRRSLGWYPDQVWIWIVAAQWRRVAQEEAFVGRTDEVGDDLGSRLVAGRIVRELMRLWFLLHRTYWPYTKWFGSAFALLPGSDRLAAALTAATRADTYVEREAGLVAAYEFVACGHNAVGITDTVDPGVRPFYTRPFRVLMADRFADACLARITDPELARLPLVGSIDQVADSTDLLDYTDRANKMRALYESAAQL